MAPMPWGSSLALECRPLGSGIVVPSEGSEGDEDGDGEEGAVAGKSGSCKSLCDIGDDSLSTVLSFLSPSDLVTCSSVCQRLRAFCKDDTKVWLPMCERRWGAQTCVQKWGRRKVPFKLLHSLLSRLENLVGFWRGVNGQGGHGSLVVFDWGPHFVTGFRITPFRPSSYGVCKVPFVWIGVSDVGRPVCFFDPSQICGEGSFLNSSPSSSAQPIPGRKQQHQQTASTIEGRKKDPFASLSPDTDLEQQAAPAGLVVVDLHFVGNFHIVMEELQQPSFICSRRVTGAAVVASFGSSGNLAAAAAAAAGTVTSPEGENSGQSPPGSFQYEMYQFLTSKVTSQGGDRAGRKLRRRVKERAFMLGRRSSEPEHFVKVREIGPTLARPLQGLWKGICDSKGLDLVLLLYDEQGGIVCRRLGECMGTTHRGSVCWTAKSDSAIRAPLPDVEQDIFNTRERILPRFYPDMPLVQGITGNFDEEIVGMLCTSAMRGLDFEFPMMDTAEGRVWQYASGRFGFGFLPKNFIVDFRPICSPSGFLLDVFD